MDERTCWSERKHDRLKSMKDMKSLRPEVPPNERSREILKMIKKDDQYQETIPEESGESHSSTVIFTITKVSMLVNKAIEPSKDQNRGIDWDSLQ